MDNENDADRNATVLTGSFGMIQLQIGDNAFYVNGNGIFNYRGHKTTVARMEEAIADVRVKDTA